MYMKFTLLLTFLVLGLKGWSQQNHFIYIQSDSKQPFYVKLDAGSSPISSSGSGYLILPKVPEGKFVFIIGFPDNSNPEQHFTCNINVDKGFMLKKFPDKGWALYDLQELTLVYADKKDSLTAGTDSSGAAPASAPVTTAPATDPGFGTAGSTATAVPSGTGSGAAPTVASGSTSATAGSSAATTATAAVAGASDATSSGAVQTTPTVSPSAVPSTPAPVPSSPAPAPPTPVPAASAPTDTTPPATKPSTDAFGDMLVAVTKDSTLKDIQAVNKPATASPKPGASAKPVAGAKVVVKGKAGITLVSTALTDAGVEQVYLDKQANGKIDTVNVLIPEGNNARAQTPDASAANAPTPSATATGAATTVATGATTAAAAASTTTDNTATSASATSAPVMVTTDSIKASGQTQDTVHVTTSVPVATVTPVDTSHAFDPNSVVKKSKDTSGFVVPVFKKGDSAATSSATAAAGSDPGFGVQPASTAPPASASTPGVQGTDPGAGNPVSAGAGRQVAGTATAAAGTIAVTNTAAAPTTTAPATSAPASTGAGSATPGLVNTDCKHLATDDEFLKLRKKIAAESDLDKMIDIAKKGFRKSCYTTDQIKNMSFLFLQEDGRYKFIEEAYPYVSDSGNFTQLQSLFSTSYYINRFKALIQH